MTILEKTAQAHELYAARKEELGRDQSICELLRRLRCAIEASGQVMTDLGIVSICRKCDEEEGGSCCGAGIESRYTPVLLLINLLLGGNLPLERLSPNGCHFLGASGCTLPARDVLCINYLCSRLQRLLGREDLLRLQLTVGNEMDLLFRLNEVIKMRLRS